MDIAYSHLTQVKRQWSDDNENIASVTDPVMNDYARRASAVIDSLTNQTFAPFIETRYYNAFGVDIDPDLNILILDKMMVELTTTTLADSTSLTTDTDVRLYPRGVTPSMQLQIYYPSTKRWTDYTNDQMQQIEITGVWCWRDRYATDGWQLSGDEIKTSTLTTTATTVKVNDVDGTDYYGDAPRFDLGMLIKIDDEYMAITDTSTAQNELTVIRAVRGSTAATHEIGAAISVFFPQPDIVRATQLMASFNYQRRGTYNRATFDGVRVIAGIELPVEVDNLLAQFMIEKLKL